MTRLITKEGFKKLQDELEHRMGDLRHEIANAIKEAKEQGDLSENAEYSEAKRQQSENEGRIVELEAMIKDAEVVKHNDNDQTVQISSTITVKSGEKKMTFVIVGSPEVDPMDGRISNESPLGSAFMGKKKGDKVEVNVPSGKQVYEIFDVK